MKNFIKSLKLLKYGLQMKTMLILSVIFFALGILMELFLTSGGGPNIISGLYLVISGVYVYQLMLTPTVSSLVQTSSFRRKLQTLYPSLLTLITTLFTFTVFVLLRAYMIASMGGRDLNQDTMDASKGILIAAVLAGLLLMYNGVCFKYYIASFIILFVVAIVIAFVGQVPEISSLFDIANSLSYTQLIVSSYGVILIGSLLGWLLSILLYRKPFDKLSIRAALRQAQAK